MTNSTDRILTALEGLADISLDELVAEAALLTRIDRKYLVAAQQAPEVLAGLPRSTRVLTIDDRRAARYASTYFDTPELTAYHGAALRRRRRFKVRTRTYVDSNDQYLEVKTEGARGVTVKERIDLHHGDLDPLGEVGREYIDETLAATHIDHVHSADLHPVLETHYRRTTLYLPDTHSRATIDTDLRWLRLGDDAAELTLPDLVIVETKSGAQPSPVDQLLWHAGIRPTAISKYATGMAAFDHNLPHNRWARVLRRHFPEPVSHAQRRAS